MFEEKNQWNLFMIWGFIFRQKLMIKYQLSMFASRDVCIYFRKKTWSHMHCWFYLYKEFTRHLSVECFESVVPAIFLSYAPTFFGWKISFKHFYSHDAFNLLIRWFHANQLYTNKFLILSFGLPSSVSWPSLIEPTSF